MEKIDLANAGGVDIRLNDLQAIYDTLKSALDIFASNHTGTNKATKILSGLKLTLSGSDYTFTSGYICLNGEVFYVAGATVVEADPGYDWFWKITETAVADSIITLEDGGSLTKRKTRAVSLLNAPIGSHTEGTDAFKIGDVPRLIQGVSTVSAEYTGNDNIDQISLMNSWTSPTYGVSVVKDANDVVHMIGELNGGSATGNQALTLPEGLRPKANKAIESHDGTLLVVTTAGAVNFTTGKTSRFSLSWPV